MWEVWGKVWRNAPSFWLNWGSSSYLLFTLIPQQWSQTADKDNNCDTKGLAVHNIRIFILFDVLLYVHQLFLSSVQFRSQLREEKEYYSVPNYPCSYLVPMHVCSISIYFAVFQFLVILIHVTSCLWNYSYKSNTRVMVTCKINNLT